MASREEIQAAVDNAKELMEKCGLDVAATADDLIDWFDTELPFPDISLGEVVVNPLLVVHELVEIDEMLKMGVALTKDVIMKNPKEVDAAHLKAAKVEMNIAHSIGAAEHIRDRIKDMECWCVDKALAKSQKADYRRLLEATKGCLSELEHRQPGERTAHGTKPRP
jgi:hypothetical protein